MTILVDVPARAITIIARHFKRPPESLDLDMRLREDLGGDSLDLLELVFELEEGIGVAVAEADLADIRTVGDSLRYVERLHS